MILDDFRFFPPVQMCFFSLFYKESRHTWPWHNQLQGPWCAHTFSPFKSTLDYCRMPWSSSLFFQLSMKQIGPKSRYKYSILPQLLKDPHLRQSAYNTIESVFLQRGVRTISTQNLQFWSKPSQQEIYSFLLLILVNFKA